MCALMSYGRKSQRTAGGYSVNVCTRWVHRDHWLHKAKFCARELVDGKCPLHGENVSGTREEMLKIYNEQPKQDSREEQSWDT